MEPKLKFEITTCNKEQFLGGMVGKHDLTKLFYLKNYPKHNISLKCSILTSGFSEQYIEFFLEKSKVHLVPEIGKDEHNDHICDGKSLEFLRTINTNLTNFEYELLVEFKYNENGVASDKLLESSFKIKNLDLEIFAPCQRNSILNKKTNICDCKEGYFRRKVDTKDPSSKCTVKLGYQGNYQDECVPCPRFCDSCDEQKCKQCSPKFQLSESGECYLEDGD
jgi:hypothetical protein